MTGIERRRSNRMVWDVGLVVRGEGFREGTFTVSVSQHGALVLMQAKVEVGQTVYLVNPETGKEVESHIVRIGSPHGGLRVVGVEFIEPSKEFWPFPVPPDPASPK